jgi:hypothetical protein
MSTFKKIIGPRAPSGISDEERRQFLLPTLLFAIAGMLLLISISLPYWEMELSAPQYPKGLHITAYIDGLEGDLFEINTLNHYIGMRPLEEAAQFERSISTIAIGATALLVLAAIFIHTQWVVLLALPTILMPVMFLADLQYWMWNFGTHLDDAAPLSNSIEPFVPLVLGKGNIAQFETMGLPGTGLYLAFLAGVLVVVGLYCHRKAYKPLVDREQVMVGEQS